MDMNNLADIVVKHVNLNIINNAIRQRAEVLGNQLSKEKADELINDISSYKSFVKSNGKSLTFDIKNSNNPDDSEYEFSRSDGFNEANHIVELLAYDAAESAMNDSISEIEEQVIVPFARECLLGGD